MLSTLFHFETVSKMLMRRSVLISGGGRGYNNRERSSFHNSNSYHPYNDRRTGYDSRTSNYHSNNDGNRYQRDRPQSKFSQHRHTEREGGYASRSDGYRTSDKVEDTASRPAAQG